MELVVEILIREGCTRILLDPRIETFFRITKGSFKHAVAYAMLNDVYSRKGWSTDLSDRVISLHRIGRLRNPKSPMLQLAENSSVREKEP